MPASRLSLGTVQLGLPYGIAGRRELMTQAQADAILDAAFELGVSSLDTAAAYGCAEQRVGDYLSRRGGCGPMLLSSKLSALGETASTAVGGRVKSDLRASMARLKVASALFSFPIRKCRLPRWFRVAA